MIIRQPLPTGAPYICKCVRRRRDVGKWVGVSVLVARRVRSLAYNQNNYKFRQYTLYINMARSGVHLLSLAALLAVIEIGMFQFSRRNFFKFSF